MAPAATETTTTETQRPTVKLTSAAGPYKELAPIGYEKEAEENGKGDFQAARYRNYLPTWGKERYSPLEAFEHRDHGLDADPALPDLLPQGVTTTELTPAIGTEVTGVQLSKLSSAGKDQLALFVAQRKVVAFRNQDFADLPVSEAVEYARYFGRLHVHPTSGAPEGFPEVHLVHRGAGDKTAETFFQTRTSSVAWHSDVSYEQQPPGTTFLYILDTPETGGDTIFSSGVEAYKRLSDGFKERLHGLKVTHSGIEQVNASRAKGGAVRREPVVSEHPIVRTHPVTGEKALYVNPQFTRSIVGYKQEESDALLKFLYDHFAYGADFQARVKWAKGTVVVWDNRITLHSALVDWQDGQRRHLARLTPQAERPTETPF
ncbi:putative alpha-ketoglutarate-dependent sulfonate dioxygenase-1 [Coleophoma crateriformis]|uniref:Putative alpha-ketoglutarate-dependent sulfonate dioxygenase-1 n=1 Tax=Coleophoma crateriformis TaxID=565419 RepID=A0A3D8S2Y4_9HELO|nr:putative alpha-ketoglutarate-dependent sulfonate dioxygenase-1 [Coleophoma crateriformis]